MPKKYDAATKERAVRMVQEQLPEYGGSLTKACAAVGARLSLPKDTVRGWCRRRLGEVASGVVLSVAEREEIKALKANSPAGGGQLDPAGRGDFLRGGARPPQPMIMDFIRTQQQQGRAVESTCRVLRGLGVQVAARTYRAWAGRRTVSGRALALAHLMNAVFTLAFAWDPATAAFRLRPEGLYGRRKMTALLARTGQQASYERVHAAMSALGHNGIRRARRHRTTIPGKDGTRAGDLLNRVFTAPAPNMVWVTDI